MTKPPKKLPQLPPVASEPVNEPQKQEIDYDSTEGPLFIQITDEQIDDMADKCVLLSGQAVEQIVWRDASNKVIKPERYCQICWGARKGYGVAYSSKASGKRYYKCQHSAIEGGMPCGHTWPMTDTQIDQIRLRYYNQLKAIVVQHRDVRLDGKR